MTVGRFIRIDREYRLDADENPLAAHVNWGPYKLAGANGSTVRRFEARLARRSIGDHLVNPADRHRDRLLERLIAIGSAVDPLAVSEDWVAPEAKTLASYISGLGYEVATDDEDNLRLTLKRPFIDGQVRVQRGTHSLRFVMPLGQWNDLDEVSIRAMVDLANEFNNRTRLARIAWFEPSPVTFKGGKKQRTKDKSGQQQAEPHRSEAQVDLTGLPHDPDAGQANDEFWCAMVGASLAGMHLALRQLAAELELLADPQHREIIELMDFSTTP
jgi:hypothetical protein